MMIAEPDGACRSPHIAFAVQRGAVAPVQRQLALAHEWYRPVDAWFGPQNALLTVLMLAGLDGVTKPALAVRPAK